MKTINLNAPAFTYAYKEKEFLPLISEDVIDKEDFTDLLHGKIAKENLDEVEGLWGTLGFDDGRKINWTGKIDHSNYGSSGAELSQSKLIKEEVEMIKEAIPELKLSNQITQKFINLSDLNIDFPTVFDENNIPKFRLELFLKLDEGAIVFYQYQRSGEDTDAMNYILPQATDNDNGFERDRLTYIFNTLPQNKLQDIKEFPGQKIVSEEKNEGEFIIKILVFKRVFKNEQDKEFIPTNSHDLINLIHDDISTKNELFVKDHKLQVYDRATKKFNIAVRNTNNVKRHHEKIDTSKRTLVLFHDVFSSTKGSFGAIYENENSWLNQLLDKGIYEQVLAFEHPTVLWNAKRNVASFIHSLINCNKSNFEHEVDFIGTGQGGLLAKTIAIQEPSETYHIKVRKVALIACTNGVGYLDFLSKSATGMKLVKKMLRTFGLGPASFVVGLVQNSVKAILKLEGFEMMLSGSDALNSILYTVPSNSDTRYLPIVSTMDFDLKDGKYKFGDGFDAFIDLFLGKHNDWVVSTKNQFKVPSYFASIDGYNPMKYKDVMFKAKHGKLIENAEAQIQMASFFEQPITDFNTKVGSEEYFDAHCHLFGRNVISARIVMMVLGDLIDYLRDNPKEEKVEKVSSSHKAKISQIVKNIFKYFLFNHGGHDMLDDLEKEYHKFRKIGIGENEVDDEVVYRYIPLMFDLEMTFKNSYGDEASIATNIKKLNDEFKDELDSFSKGIKELSSEIDKSNLELIVGSLKDKSEFSKYLKQGIQLISTIKNLEGTIKDSFDTQLNELIQLKRLYGQDIFPFIATDPRRKGMGQLIEKHVSEDKVFAGIKIYAPNGYSPADRNFYDENYSFVNGKPLYQWCVDNNIPIMAHNSNAGFATFADEIQYTGMIMDPETMDVSTYSSEIQVKNFKANLFNGGFGHAVRERAVVLNHPKIWRKVLNKYPDLKICLAHFGGDSENSDLWQKEIAQLIRDFDNVYTDLSCLSNRKVLIDIRDNFFKEEKIRNRVMYGSDYFLNMLDDISFNTYYKNFKTIFSNDLEHMSVDVPKLFLGIK